MAASGEGKCIIKTLPSAEIQFYRRDAEVQRIQIATEALKHREYRDIKLPLADIQVNRRDAEVQRIQRSKTRLISV